MKSIILIFVIQLIPSSNNYTGELKASLQENSKALAFSILQTKCNTCHSIKKRTEIFTRENMDALAPEIWKQVFVKKKMPKGRKVKLTEEESKALRNWLDIMLTEEN